VSRRTAVIANRPQTPSGSDISTTVDASCLTAIADRVFARFRSERISRPLARAPGPNRSAVLTAVAT
jgi:hypothetical protein